MNDTTTNRRRRALPILTLVLTAAFGLGLAGCDKTQADTAEPEPEPAAANESSNEKAVINLCEAYTTCNDCISGQMGRGNTEGEAETQCALAVTGCWTTWDKPVVCGEQAYDPSSDGQTHADPINLCEAYASCDECISGQMVRGNTEGEAETQCGLAVTGCWVTWDKPIVCNDRTYDNEPS